MDQLKTAGLWLRKNYFWVSCSFVTLVFLGMWYLTTSKLWDEAEQRTAALASKQQTGQSISTEPNHPNPITHAKMDERIQYAGSDVYEAWLQQYDKQRDVLTWPTSLGQEFLKVVEDLQPIEAKVPFPTQSEPLRENLRAAYRNFIDRELPKIAEIIGAKWHAGTAGASAGSGTSNLMMNNGQQEEEVDDSLVLWAASNQQQIADTRFRWGRTPSTLQILYAQEDIWVLTSIMEIIKATNGDVEHHYQAAVKSIEFIDFGSEAMGMGGMGAMGGGMGGAMSSMGSGMSGGGMSSGGMSSGGMSSGGMSSGGMSSGGMMGGGMMGGGTIDGGSGTGGDESTVDPGDNRYVDLKYQPLPAATVRAAFNSIRPEDAFLMVAKRIPVRMRLRVDQRKLTKLLAEAGNARLQLEIRQVRINRPSERSGGGGSGMGGSGMAGAAASSPGGMTGGSGGSGGAMMSSGGAGMASGMQSGMSSGANMRSGGSSRSGGSGSGSGSMTSGSGMMGGNTTADESPYDIDVELFGIIYIYNPVDRQKLGRTLEEAPAEPVVPNEETAPTTARKEDNETPTPVVAAAG